MTDMATRIESLPDAPPDSVLGVDTGTAYGFQPGTHDAMLTEVGAGTRMGELMRRYWHPVGLSSYASDLPRAVRILGEDLVLFRGRDAVPASCIALCAPRCVTALRRIDDHGIRCATTAGRSTNKVCAQINRASLRTA